jgi:hypothetical protein
MLRGSCGHGLALAACERAKRCRAVLRNATIALDNIISDIPEAAALVLEQGGVPLLSTALKTDDDVVVENCVTLLSKLSEDSLDCATHVLDGPADCMKQLLRILEPISTRGVLESLTPVEEAALATIINITACTAVGAAVLFELGGVQQLTPFIHSTNTALQVLRARCMSRRVFVL